MRPPFNQVGYWLACEAFMVSVALFSDGKFTPVGLVIFLAGFTFNGVMAVYCSRLKPPGAEENT